MREPHQLRHLLPNSDVGLVLTVAGISLIRSWPHDILAGRLGLLVLEVPVPIGVDVSYHAQWAAPAVILIGVLASVQSLLAGRSGCGTAVVGSTVGAQ
jgi:hypothetical protein